MIVASLSAALVVLMASTTVLWTLDRRERQVEQQRQQWRERSLRAHRGRCPWSGKRGIALDGVERVVACPRCAEVFVSWSDEDLTLPDHMDDRSR